MTRWLCTFAALAALTLTAAPARSADKPALPPGQHAQQFQSKDGKHKLQYLVFLPRGYDRAKEPLPFILFLHGAGERGDNIELVKKHGPPKIAEKNKNFPFIVVSPQCPTGRGWRPAEVLALLDHALQSYPIDPHRVYLTGLSMGGFGTWATSVVAPQRFAAIVPICGGGDPSKVEAIKNVPTWVFHGEKDPVVPIKRAKDMVDALKAVGGNVRFTIYPGVGHNSWEKAYDDPELYTWMLKQSTKDRSK